MSLSTIKHAFHRPAPHWLFFLALSGVLALTPLAFASLLMLLLATVRVLRWQYGLWSGLTVSFLALSGVVAMIAAAAWLLHAPLSASFILVSVVAIILALLCVSPTQPRILPGKDELLDADDWISLVVAIACMVVVCVPLLPRAGAATVLPILMYGGDNSAHLDIFRTLDRNQGFAIGTNNRANLGSILVAYPQGWHFTAVFIKWTLQGMVPIGSTPTSVLLFFYITGVAWLGMLALLITRLSLLVLHQLSRPKVARSITIFARILVALGCFIGINGYMLSLFAYGFQTQVAALVFLLAEILALIAAYASRDLQKRYGYILLATLLLAGGGFSWLFLYPVSVLLLAGAVVQTIVAYYRRLPLYFAIGLLIFGACALFQPFIQILVPVPAFQDGVNVINQRGNVVETDIVMLGMLALAVAIWAYAYFRQTIIRILLAGLACAMAFSLVLMWYQLSTIHELRYYYYKSIYTAIMLVVILLAALLGWAAETLMSIKTPVKYPAVIHKMLIGISLLGVLAISPSLIKSPIYEGFLNKALAGISPSQASAVVGIVAAHPELGWRVVSIGSCNRGDDIRATLLARSLSVTPPSSGVRYPGSYIHLDYLDKHELFAGIEDFASQEQAMPALIILSNDQVIGLELTHFLSPAALAHIQLVNLDTTLYTEPVSQCPERVRYIH